MTVQPSVTESRSFHQNVHKLIGNTRKRTVLILHLDILCLLACK